jgi:hypothetical protein
MRNQVSSGHAGGKTSGQTSWNATKKKAAIDTDTNITTQLSQSPLSRERLKENSELVLS